MTDQRDDKTPAPPVTPFSSERLAQIRRYIEPWLTETPAGVQPLINDMLDLVAEVEWLQAALAAAEARERALRAALRLKERLVTALDRIAATDDAQADDEKRGEA